MTASTESPPLFTEDAPIHAIGERLLACTLPKPEWTHAAHCIAGLYLMRRHPGLDLERFLPGIIWRYNESTGTANTDSGGYHETITQFYIEALRAFLKRMPAEAPLFALCNRLLASRFGQRDFPLDYYSRERLFSVMARRVWVDPDRRPFDFAILEIDGSAA